jgi:glycosyltransferase involved in cell wall biosynthesis
MRVVIISHGHPRFARGGGEVAAYNLFQGINNSKGHQAWLLARAPQPLLHLGTQLAQIDEREYLFPGEAECEDLCASLELGPDDEFAQLLKRLKPDVIHFHHYYYVGIEVLRVARQACPQAKLVLTFHEYMAICAMHGTMVKKDMRLCYQASPRDCQQCLPDRGPDWFFLREQYLKSFLQLVDHYVSPSRFLAQRYIDWGLAADKFTVIDNGISSDQRLPPRPLAAGEGRTRFAFFGQCHPYKGLDLILEAIGSLPKALRSRIRLDVHASGLEQMKGDYPKKLKALLKQHKDFAQYHGPYEQHELPQLMAACDWVLMGSIWWENSPLVIQEAWKFGRPVICPELGGMAEKLRPGVGGLLYRARSEAALAGLVRELVEAPDDSRYQELLRGLPQHHSVEACTKAHLQLYRLP